MSYKIIPLKLASTVEKPEMSVLVYRHTAPDRYEEFQHGFFALQDGRETILIDTGGASNDEIWEMDFDRLEDGPGFFEVLAQHSIDPNTVKTVIMTHLHWDHSWNLDKLPNAAVYVQRKELYHAVTPYLVERTSYGYVPVPKYNVPRWLSTLDRVVPVDGEAEILPGIRVIPTPGHTHGSQSVLVDTDEGTYAITGDLFFHFESWEKAFPVGRGVSIPEWYESYHKMKALKLAGILATHAHETYRREVYG